MIEDLNDREDQKKLNSMRVAEWRKNNKDKNKENAKIWYEKNKEENLKKGKEWRIKNQDKVKESKRKWLEKNSGYVKKRRADNKENEAKRLKEWRKDNKERTNETQRNYRTHIIPHIVAWRSVLNNHLNRLGKKKEGDTIDLLGYSALELKNHLVSLFTEGMSWDNYGEWHVDHIIPVINFDKETPPSIVNALTNLRPLWATTREINGIIYEGNLNRRKSP